MKELYNRWNGQVRFIEVLIRQAHPGPGAQAYETYEQKKEDARRYREAEQIPWTVLVDTIPGEVHQAYGGLSNPTYLINARGEVAFYNLWSHAPSLERALNALLARHEGCVVRGGVDREPHLFAPMVDGWRGLERGMPQSFAELERAAPGLPYGLKFGHRLKPLLAPLALRSRPLPAPVRMMLAGMGIVLLLNILRSGRG